MLINNNLGTFCARSFLILFLYIVITDAVVCSPSCFNCSTIFLLPYFLLSYLEVGMDVFCDDEVHRDEKNGTIDIKK